MENNIIEADYTIMQERTLPVIISEIHIIEHNVTKTALDGAVQIGARLQEAKGKVGHGNFEQWCQENLNYSKRTAERFMKLAAEYGDENGMLANATTMSHFSITKALSLLKVPEEERETFTEEHDIEGMTAREMEEAVRAANEERDAANAEAEKAEAALEEKTKAADRLEAELEKKQKKLDWTAAKLLKEQEGRQAQIDAAIEEKKAEIEKKAQKDAGEVLLKAETERKNLKEENEALKRKLANAGNEMIIRFKVLVDQLQDTFDQACQCIEIEQAKDRAVKMDEALRQVVEKLSGNWRLQDENKQQQ